MKFFMPVYAVALTLAVTSSMFEQASGAVADACTVANECPSSSCTLVTDGKVTPAVPLPKPSTGAGSACPQGTKAYIAKLTVVPDVGDGTANSATLAADLDVRINKAGGDVSTSATAETKGDAAAGATCSNQYFNLGKDGTADVKATITCAATKPCKFNYKATWACQAYVACDAATICTGTACTTVSTTASAATTTGSLARPATTVLGTCADKKFAYVKKIQIFPVPAAPSATPPVPETLVDSVKVTAIKDGTTTAVAVDKDNYPACANQFSNIGKDDATADVKVTIGCDSGTNCNFKYKIEWGCQGDSFAPTTAPPASTTAAPSSAVSYPVAAWGTALVAAVAGANFAAPL